MKSYYFSILKDMQAVLELCLFIINNFRIQPNMCETMHYANISWNQLE